MGINLTSVPIKIKFIGIVMLACSVALVVAGIILSLEEQVNMKGNLVRNTRTAADIVAANATAAIAFNSITDAHEVLLTLDAEPDVVSARIFTTDGAPFASYVRDTDELVKLPERPGKAGEHFDDNHLLMYRTIALKGDQLGVLFVKVHAGFISDRLNRFILVLAGAIALSLVIALAITSRMQNMISQPVQHLAEVVKEVSNRKDYSLRATGGMDDEIGFLIAKFNEMLDNVQSRDAQLQEAHDSLEIRVRERTRELESEIRVRRRVEDQLRAESLLSGSVIEKVGEGICVFHETDGFPRVKFTVWNRRMAEITGYTAAEINQQGWFELLYPDLERRQHAMECLSRIAVGEDMVTEEYLIRRKDGEYRDLLISTARLDKTSSIEHHVGLLQDITERKQAESQQRELQDQLERAQRMESLGVLAGGVAHDLNNMLGPLVGYPELILRKLPEESPFRRQVETIGKSAKDAADVVQDLLTLARRGRYEMEPTDLNQVIETYLQSPSFHRLQQHRPEIELTVSLDPSRPVIEGSSPHLAKVIMNLIVNAYDAMTGTGTLRVATEESYLEQLESGHQNIGPGHYVSIRVKDSGNGIDKDDLDKIFEPYYSKKKMGTSGSGLGLSVVYGIVKDHRGYYDIFSELGVGTEFVLYFPVCTQELSDDDDKAELRGGHEKILIVDDVLEQREMASTILSDLGYEVATAQHGRAAVRYLQENQADLVLLDMIMEKDFDGLDTYREILKSYPEQKAIVVSGFSQTERVAEVLRLGASGYLKKPYTMESLGMTVRECLESKPKTAPAEPS